MARFLPTSLFSLKASNATSSVGKTLLVPTPYSIKMALIDAAFRSGWDGNIDALIEDLALAEVSIGVPAHAAVTHTIVKIRQEPKARKPLEPYIAAVAYREFVFHQGECRWAFNLGTVPERGAQAIIRLLPAVNSIGKRGGFVQFLGLARAEQLDATFTQAMELREVRMPERAHVAMLDDFGPEANLKAMSSYSPEPIRRDKHRKFVRTIVPMGVVNVGSGFTQYQAAPAEGAHMG
ncbi:MAG: hypothetical protein IT169_06315 [Bryobacterales bacterium]|nr:hypothetical protein [Bryobacterales bacterium]